jgi:hypothetical protein
LHRKKVKQMLNIYFTWSVTQNQGHAVPPWSAPRQLLECMLTGPVENRSIELANAVSDQCALICFRDQAPMFWATSWACPVDQSNKHNKDMMDSDFYESLTPYPHIGHQPYGHKHITFAMINSTDSSSFVNVSMPFFL